jgi:hypothetical protein
VGPHEHAGDPDLLIGRHLQPEAEHRLDPADTPPSVLKVTTMPSTAETAAMMPAST